MSSPSHRSPSEVLKGWKETAQIWKRHSATLRIMFQPISRAMIEQGAIAAGDSVLDVAGGTGDPALTIADVCGPTGKVACTDAVFEMVAAARREAESRALTHFAVAQCVCDSLPFRSDSFDVAVCRLGVMFFSNPLLGIREALRVLKPGGRICFAVWGRKQANPFLAIAMDTAERRMLIPPSDPDAPGGFRFAEPGKLAGLFHKAGVNEVRERILPFRIEGPVSLDEYWPFRSDLSDVLRANKAKLSAAQRATIEGEAREAARPFFPNGRMGFPAEAIIVGGRKS